MRGGWQRGPALAGAVALAVTSACGGAGDDGGDGPLGVGGGEAARRSPPGSAQVVRPEDVPDLELTPVTGAMGTETVHVALTGTAEVEVIGQGDAATRPADGEHFVVAEVVVTPVAPSPVLDDVTRSQVATRGWPAFAVEVPGGDRDGVEIEAVVQVGEPVQPPTTYLVAASVPDTAAEVDLVLTFDDVEQRLSLLTGAPGPDNIALLARLARDMPAPPPPQTLTFHRTELGREDHLTEPLAVTGASLQWVPGLEVTTPAPPGRAFLHVGFDTASANWLLASELRLPDGTVLAPLEITRDPEVLAADVTPGVVFDVPADLTEATLVVGKDYRVEIPVSAPNVIAADFEGTVEYPIAIPPG